MLRLSKLSDYAVVVLVRLGQQSDRVSSRAPGTPSPASPYISATTAAIATATGVPEPTVAKVLKALAGAGLVESRRGARGGYWLARSMSAISVADVITAIDGPIALTSCVDGRGDCEVGHLCAVRGRWDVVNAAVETALRAVSMADLADCAVPAAFRLPSSAQPAHSAQPAQSTHSAQPALPTHVE